MSLKINRLQHTGIPVADIRISEAFYKRLGFSNVMERTFAHSGGDATVIMMQLDDIIMELYQLPEPHATELKSRGDGHVDHICFDVDDAVATMKYLNEAGFAVQEREPTFLNFWEHGTKFVFITGPDGERLEFNEIVKL